MTTISRSRASIVPAALAVLGAVTAFAATPASPAGALSSHHNRFHELKLVADRAGHARITDHDLVNAWGLAFSPTSPLWVSNNGSSTSTLYSGATSPGTPPTKVPLTVSIPAGGAPTGVVYNPTSKFVLSTHGKSGPASFIFAGEHGSLTAWNGSGDPNTAVPVAHVGNTIYKGLAMVMMHGKPFLLAANFHRNRIDVFNGRFRRVHKPRAFRSVGIPQGYAPFNVASLRNRVYVAYAKQDATKEDDTSGPGHGFINVFGNKGHFLRSLVRRRPLNSPWGLAVAPHGFNGFGGDLLVGNFGNGRIHVVSPRSGHVIATLRNRRGQALVIDGLWGLLPGNGTAGGKSDVWFSAGPNEESHGLLGILRPQHN